MAVPRSRIEVRISVLAPDTARRAGAYPAEARFDLALLDVLRDRMVEVGQASVRCPPSDRIPLPFSELARYLIENGYDYVIGSVGVGVSDGGHIAASLYRAISETSMSPEDLRVVPYRRLPLERLIATRDARPTELLQAFLDRGAWVCGEPAIDPRAERADLPMLLPLARMRDPYARRFLSLAA